MSVKVSASVSVNPITNYSRVGSTSSEYLQYSNVLNSSYTEYATIDREQGSTKEINKAYTRGKHLGGGIRLSILNSDVEDPYDTYNSIEIESAYVKQLEFMPMAEIKSDYHPRGVIKLNKNNKYRIKSSKLLKTMNLTLESVSKGLVDNQSVPPLGSPEWGKFSLAYARDSKSKVSIATYRNQLKQDIIDKKKADKDITDISIGYFGKFNNDMRVSGKALFETYLEILPLTHSYKGTDNNLTRKFKLESKLFKAKYTMNGYIHRTVNTTIPNNTKRSIGYSEISVHLEDETPLDTSIGIVHHTDYDDTVSPFFDRTNWTADGTTDNYSQMRKVYVSIKVQKTPTSYDELILVDLFQETTIEGNGKTRVGNSGHQNEQEGEMTWVEAYIAESFIPLTRSAMLKVKLFDRRRLIAETKSTFIQVVNITHLKWYQTKLFQAVLRIVGFVISIFLGFSDGGSIGTVLVNIAINLIVSYGVSYALKYLVKSGVIKSEALLILLVAVTTVYASNYGGNLDFSLYSTTLNLLEATGKVYQTELVVESEEYKKELAKLKAEAERYENTPTEYSSTANAQFIMNLNRLVEEANTYHIESVDEFMARVSGSNNEPINIYDLTIQKGQYDGTI